MKLNGLYSVIRSCEYNYKHRNVPILGTVEYSQAETIEKIDKYYNSKFYENTDDTDIFLNIVKPAVRNHQKNLDYDTKDVAIKAKKGKDLNYFKARMLRYVLREWMKEARFGQILNKMKEYLPKYGSVYVKNIKSKEIFEVCEPSSLFVDQTINNIKDSWALEIHYFSPAEIVAKREVWDSNTVDLLLANFRAYGKENYVISDESRSEEETGNDLFIKVYEFSGYVEAKLVDSSKEGLVYVHTLCVMPEVKNPKDDKSYEGIELFKEVYDLEKQDLYRQLDHESVPGRNLGNGIVEDLFPVQRVKNKQANLLNRAQELANLILFATNSPNLVGNVLTDLDNGDIVNFKGQLTRIDTQIRNIGGYQLLNAEIQKVGNDLANMYEVTTGEALPAGTPFSLGALINQNANKFFDVKKEDFGLFIEELLNDWVLPRIKNRLTEEYLLEIFDQDEIEELKGLIVKDRVWSAIKSATLAGIPMTPETVSVIDEAVTNELTRDGVLRVKLPKGFLSDILDDIELVMTGENINKGARTRDLMTALQMLKQNPGLANDPGMKELLDHAGLTVSEVVAEAKEVGMQVPQQVINMPELNAQTEAQPA